MRDDYGREIDYLRISLTDRCNFRCSYCMPAEGVKLFDSREILSYEELLRVIAVLARNGVNKIRLTGGEPLVRLGIVDFIRRIKALGTIKDLSMTTNGSLLAPMAKDLKEAGLDRVNVSIDTINPEKFTAITRRGVLQDTLDGIESAFESGLTPVKLNVVLTDSVSADDVAYFTEQVYTRPLVVRFIEYMPIGSCGVKSGYNTADIKQMINSAGFGEMQLTEMKKSNGPAKYYRLPGAKGLFGFITPISDHFCHNCTRIRLTADGKIKPCLLANAEIDLKKALRDGASDQKIYQLFFKALRHKPNFHMLKNTNEDKGFVRAMSQVGG